MLKMKYTGWSNIPIGKYERLKAIFRDEGLDNREAEVLAVLCDCSVEDVMNAPVREFHELMTQIGWLFVPLNVRDRLRFKTIVLDGVKYEIHTDFKDITTAQYIDFQNLYQDFEKNYCNILATFILPKGKRYNEGYDVLEVAETFREKMPVEVAENACFFFACRSRGLLLRGLRKMIVRTGLMEAREKDMGIQNQLREARMQLTQERETIDGLARLMRCPTPKV